MVCSVYFLKIFQNPQEYLAPCSHSGNNKFKNKSMSHGAEFTRMMQALCNTLLGYLEGQTYQANDAKEIKSSKSGEEPFNRN